MSKQTTRNMKTLNLKKIAPLYLVLSRVNAKKEISTRIFPLTRAVQKGNSWFYPAGSGTKEVPVKSLNLIDSSEIKNNIFKSYCYKNGIHDAMEKLEAKCEKLSPSQVAVKTLKKAPVVKKEKVAVVAPVKRKVELLVPVKSFSQKDIEDINAVNDILSGNQHAFKTIYKRYYLQVHRSYVSKLRYNVELADDITEDLFIKVFENIDKYKPEFTFNSWISKLSKNFLIDYVRKKKLETVSYNSNVNNEDMEFQFVDSNALSGEQILIEEEKKTALNKALMQLDKRSREALSLYYMYGKSYKEIEKELNCSESTIKIAIYRAKQKLKTILTSDSGAMAVLVNN